MAVGLTTKVTGDGNLGTITSKFLSSDGTNTGALRPAVTLYTSADTEVDLSAGTAGSPAGPVSSIQGVSAGVPVQVGSSPNSPTPTSLTRTNDTAAYVANDVIGIGTGGSSTTPGLASLDLGICGSAGADILITSVSLEIDVAAVISGMGSYRLYLYNVTPPSALVDNNAWDLPAGDRASFLGYVDFGSPVDLGSTLYVEVNGINKHVKLSGTHLFGYLVTLGAYTPSASMVHKITVHVVGL